jgi:hypothetical protein
MRFRILIPIACLACAMMAVSLLQRFRDSADGVFLLTPNGDFCAIAFHGGRCIIYHRDNELGALSRQTPTIQSFSVDPSSYDRTMYGPFYTTYNFLAARAMVGPEWNYSFWQSPPPAFHQLIIPFWTWILLAIPGPALMISRFVRVRRRRLRGLCLNCGYDLRFSPQRCPECGTGVALPE